MLTDFDSEEEHAQREEAGRKAELEAKRDEDAIRWVMASPLGRHAMWRLLDRGHVFRTTFTGDALTGAFAEGERNVGLRYLNDMLLHCPDEYNEMLREHHAR